VAQDVRGKVRSEGAAFAFTAEVRDGADTLEWIESRRWCDGSVVMFGDSYYGFTQWAAAASGHRALRAIVPRNTTTEIGTDWMYHQGVFCLDTMLGWAAHAWMGNALYEFPDGIDWTLRPLAGIIGSMFGGQSCPSLDAWRAASPDDRFWTSGIYGESDLGSIRIPALHVGGWWDVFRRGQMRDFARATAHASGQHLLFEQSDHYDDLLVPDGAPHCDYLADPALVSGLLPRYLDPALDFCDYYLRGVGSPPPAVRWRLSNAEMRTSPTWPPALARTVDLFPADAGSALHGPAGGALLARPERGTGRVSWVHNPADPVPSLVTEVWRPLLGLPDERRAEIRPDVATFSGEPVSAPMDIAGPVSARLFAGPAAHSAHLMTKLVDVFPDGRARRITEGACRVAAAADGRLVTVNMSDIGYRLLPGHSLRLEVAGSDFPRYIVHPGADADPWLASGNPPVAQQIRTGSRSGSLLRLTVLS
jgi:uncharacterized protein